MVKKFEVEGFENFKAKAEELAKVNPSYNRKLSYLLRILLSKD